MRGWRARYSIVALAFCSAACSSDDSGDAAGGDDAGSEGGDAATFELVYEDPSKLGPYAVGSITRTFVDEGRPEAITTDDPDDLRTLVTEIWFPASDAARDQPKDVFGGFLTDDARSLLPVLAPALGTTAETIQDALVREVGSVREADIAEGGPFPVVLFSHGNTGFRFQSIFLTEYLASHGYVVVAPDHSYNAGITQLESGTVVYNPLSTAFFQERYDDMPFLLDVMTELNTDDPDGRFTGKLDLENVGITGHSFGGATTLAAVETDDRFDVGAPMTAGGPSSGSYGKPMMHFLAEEDATVSNDAIQAQYDNSEGARWLLRVIDAGHFSFSNICLLAPDYGDGCGEGMRASGETFTFLDDQIVHGLTNYYQTALYGFYLKGIDEYADDLRAEPFADHVSLTVDRFP